LRYAPEGGGGQWSVRFDLSRMRRPLWAIFVQRLGLVGRASDSSQPGPRFGGRVAARALGRRGREVGSGLGLRRCARRKICFGSEAYFSIEKGAPRHRGAGFARPRPAGFARSSRQRRTTGLTPARRLRPRAAQLPPLL